MDVTYFNLALIAGLLLSLLVEELFGISAGGMIVPGYLAMVCDDIPQMLLIFAVSFAIFFIINYVLPHFVILFGRRKFVATLIVGIFFKLLVELLFPMVLPVASLVEFRGVGIITPALIANCYYKQGIRYTVPAVLVVSYLTFGIVTVLFKVF
ncbi:MAG: poly-gamma-glutamate biosynthesis protein PgsC [Clostridia bacterium]|nr:poly-gamma-glutamate biosynthesis protein PgsC [Clostridia bacterium]